MMDNYLMMLYVSLEQETAMKKLFADNDWNYCKPDLLQITDALGGLIVKNESKQNDSHSEDSSVIQAKKTTVISFPTRPTTRSQKTKGVMKTRVTVEKISPKKKATESLVKEEPTDLVNDDDFHDYMEYGDEDDDFIDDANKYLKKTVKTPPSHADCSTMVDTTAKLDGTEDVKLEHESMVCGDAEIGTDDESNETNIDNMTDIYSEPVDELEDIIESLVHEEQSDNTGKTIHSKKGSDARVQYQCGHCKVKFLDKKKLNKHLTDKACQGEEAENEITEGNVEVDAKGKTGRALGDILLEETENIDEVPENITDQGDVHRFDEFLAEGNTDEISEESEKLATKRNFYRCDQCELAYRTPYNLKAHQALKHQMTFDESLTCDVCNLSYGSEHILKLHKADKHPKSSASEEKVQCDDCEVLCDDFKSYLNHKKKQHNVIVCKEVNRCHFCLECGKAFTRSDSLKSHYEIIHLRTRKRKPKPKPTERKYVCDFCGKAFLRQNNLSEHISVKHENTARKYKCNECGEVFLRPYALEYHTNKVHLHVKPYECKKCKKKYHSSINLRQHQDICLKEEEEKEACPYCDKKFCHKRNLSMHIEAIHSDSPLTCECGYVIKWRSSVAKHKRQCILNKDNAGKIVRKHARGRKAVKIKTELPRNIDTNVESGAGTVVLSDSTEIGDAGFTTISTDTGMQVVSDEIAQALRDQGLLVDGAVAGTVKMEDGKTVVEEDPTVQSVYYVIMKE